MRTVSKGNKCLSWPEFRVKDLRAKHMKKHMKKHKKKRYLLPHATKSPVPPVLHLLPVSVAGGRARQAQQQADERARISSKRTSA